MFFRHECFFCLNKFWKIKPDIIHVQFSDTHIKAKCCRECALSVEAMIEKGYSKKKETEEENEAI